MTATPAWFQRTKPPMFPSVDLMAGDRVVATATARYPGGWPAWRELVDNLKSQGFVEKPESDDNRTVLSKKVLTLGVENELEALVDHINEGRFSIRGVAKKVTL